MRTSRQEAAHQRKIFMTVLIVVIIAAAVLGGGFYFWQQARANSSAGSSAESQQTGQVQEDPDTVQYQGSTYKYNDHLSNYLFMGIDSRDDVDSYESQQDAGQADSIFLVSLESDTAAEGSVYSKRFHDKD